MQIFNYFRSWRYFDSGVGVFYRLLSPRGFEQARIIKFPGYSGFAQSFPGTMPNSESIGLITDLRKVTNKDTDAVFYLIAHETVPGWAARRCRNIFLTRKAVQRCVISKSGACTK